MKKFISVISMVCLVSVLGCARAPSLGTTGTIDQDTVRPWEDESLVSSSYGGLQQGYPYVSQWYQPPQQSPAYKYVACAASAKPTMSSSPHYYVGKIWEVSQTVTDVALKIENSVYFSRDGAGFYIMGAKAATPSVESATYLAMYLANTLCAMNACYGRGSDCDASLACDWAKTSTCGTASL